METSSFCPEAGWWRSLHLNIDLDKLSGLNTNSQYLIYFLRSPEEEKNASGASDSMAGPPCTRAELVNLDYDGEGLVRMVRSWYMLRLGTW